MSSVKTNFAVSAYTQIWHPDAKRIFAIDAYIPHALERSGKRDQYDIVAASPLRTTRDKCLSDHDFVDKRFQRCSEIIAGRLDEFHQTAHGQKFWHKAMGLSLLRHVSFCFDIFQSCEAYLDPEANVCRTLDPENFNIPLDFDQHRQIFQHTDLGREQLFSVYCTLFYPEKFPHWKSAVVSGGSDCNEEKGQARTTMISKVAVWAGNPQRSFRKIVEKMIGIRAPEMAIIECSFSTEHRFKLLYKSRGLIQTLSLPAPLKADTAVDWTGREMLSRADSSFDRFDRFVFASLKHAFPRLFIENFQSTYAVFDAYFRRYARLRWIVCEWWIGSNWSAFALAVAMQRGIKHLYCEHNYYGHPFLGNNLRYIFPLVNMYVTLGWADPSVPNLFAGASLYQWKESSNSTGKPIEVLFISSIPNAYSPEINASYGESGASAVISYLNFNRRFFGALSDQTLGSIYFRAYPARIAEQCMVWDQKFMLREYMDKVKVIDDSVNQARNLMKQARLVVVNYLSTSYIEALVANVPTVILWNPDTYYIRPEFSEFLAPLIKVGICQDNPVKGAEFVELIKENPGSWWMSQSVQEARQQFLEENFGAPEKMINLLLGLAKGIDDGA